MRHPEAFCSTAVPVPKCDLCHRGRRRGRGRGRFQKDDLLRKWRRRAYRWQHGAPIADITNQIDRSSLSSLLNTAEGNSKRQLKIRAKFFDDARGSAAESAACLDAMVAKRLCKAARVLEGKSMLLRIVQMLSKLVDRFDPSINRNA